MDLGYAKISKQFERNKIWQVLLKEILLFSNYIVLWSNQNSIILSMAEAGYIVVGSCCVELLWMKHTLYEF